MPPYAQLLMLVAIVILFYVVLARPARKQQQQLQRLQGEIGVGDEVVLSSGILGTIREMQEQTIRLEVAPGVVLRVARQAVVRRAPETDERPAPPPAEES